MKVLVLNGSPRVKSNTMIITNEFLEGFKEKVPDADIEVIDLKKTEIRPCLGCFGCWTKTPGKCVINDEMRNVLFPKFLDADIVVWSIPLYFFALPSEAKAFMDRTLPFALPYIEEGGTGHPHRYEKMPRMMVISNCGFYDEKIFEPMDAMFSLGYGEHETLYRTQGELFAQGIAALTGKTMAAIRQCGREYATDGRISDKTREEATAPIMEPELFTKMANQHWDDALSENQKAGGEKACEEIPSGDLTPGMMVAYLSSVYDKTAYTKDMEVEMIFPDCNETYTFHVTKDALTGAKGPAAKPDLSIKIDFKDWMAISKGEASGEDLVMAGNMIVKGGLPNLEIFTSLIMPSAKDEEPKVDKSAEKAHKAPERSERGKRLPHMIWMLLPWMLFMMAANPIGSFFADSEYRILYQYTIVSAIAVAITLMAYTKFELTKLDWLSVVLIVIMSVVAIVCDWYDIIDVNVIVSCTYVMFGLVWLIPAYVSTPPSCYYIRSSDPRLIKNKIYLLVHRNICTVWAVVLFFGAAAHFIIENSTMAMVTTLLVMVLAIVFSMTYPRYRIKKEWGIDIKEYDF